MLEAKEITRSLKEYRDVVEVMKTAFPEEEQTSVWLLRLFGLRKDMHFRAYYDERQFVGFSFVAATKAMAFILYIAVRPDLQSKGYGSRIAEAIQKDNASRELSLNMESLDPAAENNGQRLRRYQFYLKNGFHDTGYRLLYRKVNYMIMSKPDNFHLAEYKKAMGRLGGMIGAKISRVQ